MTTPERRDYLRANIEKLPEKDRGFANSLCNARYPSQKQWHWIGVMADRIDQPKPVMENVEIGDMQGINNMFAHYAAHHVKLPKIVLHTAHGLVVIHPAGEGSAYPGCIQVKEREGQRRWLGRINSDGTFVISPKFGTASLHNVIEKLRDLSAHPLEVAALHGRLTGRCCFCNTPLRDERSTQMGYGPVCADSFGLDWGRQKFSFAATPVEVVQTIALSVVPTVRRSNRRIKVRA